MAARGKGARRTAPSEVRAFGRYPRKQRAALATAALATAGAIALFVTPAYAVLTGVAPTTDATTGLPDYYQDSTGLRLTACDDGTAACAGVTKAQYAGDTTGGFEDFFSLAQSVITGPVIAPNHAGVKFTSVLALEAIHDPAGQPTVLQRIRSRVQLGAPNATYQVVEPYGTQTVTTNASGQGTTTQDIGCAGLANDPPCDFTKALATGFGGAAGSLGPFIQWDTGAPAGYIGDGATDHAIKGSPTGHNLFQVTGPGVQNGNPSTSGTITSTLYTVTGKIFVPPAAPIATVTPTSLTFAAQDTGTTSAAQTVTVKNTGNADLVIGTTSISTGEFVKGADTCAGQTVAAAGTCTIAVTFAPAASGAAGGRTATLSIADNAAGSPHSVSLNGTATVPVTGAPAVTITPASLTFASQNTGTTSAAKTVTVKNTGTANLVVATTSISTAEFVKGADTCAGNTIPAAGTCTIAVTFSPAASGAAGARSASLTIADNATPSPQTVPLSGTATVAPPPVPGIAVSCPAACTTLAFGSNSFLFGGTGVTKTVTVTSNGTAPLVLGTVTIGAATTSSQPADYSITANTCIGTKAPGTTCSISVKFRTKALSGARNATLLINSNVTASPTKIAMTGTGSL